MTTETIAASDRRIVTLDVIRGVAVMGILSVNIVGDALRDVLDPRTLRERR